MAGGETWVSGDHARVFMGEEILTIETKHRATRFPLMNVLYWEIDKEGSDHPSTHTSAKLIKLAEPGRGPEYAEDPEDDEYDDGFKDLDRELTDAEEQAEERTWD
jgi:hypothetical protein